MTIRSLTLSWG